jgi:5-methylcytosine-specific restriction protein A
MAGFRRQLSSEWQATRTRIWRRDNGHCQGPYCHHRPFYSLPLNAAQIDHILERSKGGTDTDANLRTLCRRCHCLRASIAHQGMIAAALREGLIPSDWRSLVWDD